jgi:radical SAM protein with 4Fe4S-binding SPASM domain
MSTNIIGSFKNLIFHNSLCVLPWHGFALFPNGNIKNCAISRENLGNIEKDNVADILDNQKSYAVRQDMQSDIKNNRCISCYRTEDLQQSHPIDKISNRIWYMKVIKNHDLSVYDHNQFVNNSILDLRWRNTCNYSCIYCGPDLSSKWAAERNKMLNNRVDEKNIEKVKSYVLSQVKTIKHVYLAGGEPLLIKENLELLEELKKYNPDVTIRINTNLSVIDNKIFKMLVDDFKNTKWTISIDNIGEDYEYVRYPGNWDNFLSNLTYLYSKTKNIDYNMTWSVLNAFTIFDAIDFLQTKFLCPDSVFVIQPIFIPKSLQIGNLSDDTLDQLKLIIQERALKCTSNLYKNSLQSMMSCLELPTPKKLNKTIKYLDIINRQRLLSFPKSLTNLLNKEKTHGQANVQTQPASD